MSGNIIAQMIAMASVPVVTRLYSPESMGIFALFMTIVIIISMVSLLCYERAILIADNDEEASHIFVLAIIIISIICPVCFLFFLVYKDLIAGLLQNKHFSPWAVYIPLGIFLTGCGNLFRFWRLREKAFGIISRSRVSGALATAFVKIAIGFYIGSWAGGLIWGFIIGTAVSIAILFLYPDRIDIKAQLQAASIKQLKKVAKLHRQFPLFASWNGLLNQTSQYMAIFLFSYFFSAAIVGFYSISNAVLKQPLAFITESVRNVFFQRAGSKVVGKKPLIHDLRNVTLGLAAAGILPFTVLMIFGVKIFVIILGSKWLIAGEFIQIQAAWFFTLFIASPSDVIYEVCRKQDIRLAINIFIFSARFVSLVTSYYVFKDIMSVMIVFTLTNLSLELMRIAVAFFIARGFDKKTINLASVA